MVLAAVPNDYNMTTEIVTPCEKQATNRQLCLVERLCCTNQLKVEFPLSLDRVIPQLP